MTAPTYNTPTTSAVEPIKVVADVIQREMGLTSKQVVLQNQDYSIPPNGLLVVLGYSGPTEELANQGYFDPVSVLEVQEVVVRHTIQIDLLSLAPDNSARIRKEEVALALRSFYSLQQQDKNSVGIAWLQSDFLDASALETSVMLNRFTTTCAVNALHRKTKPAAYLSSFQVSLSVAPPATPVDASQAFKINPAVAPNPPAGS